MNYVELHIGDYDKATAHLTACEDGIYGRLIRWYYDIEGPLPSDMKAIQRRVRARARDEKAAVETVLEEFFELQADGWHHRRCDEEIAKYQDKREKAQRSANARWNAKRNDSEGMRSAHADDMRTHCGGNARQSPDTSNNKSVRESAGASQGTPEDPQLPADVDPERWASYRDQLADDGKLSISRIKTALLQLRRVSQAGHDPNAVLTAAVMRGLRDLDDCAARLAREKAAATARASPESRSQQSRTVQAMHALNEVTEHVTQPETAARLDDARIAGWSEEAALPELGAPAVR